MESVLFIYVFFWVVVWPCQLFVRLWYRVSDVLDLSLVSKRFGFWLHITHVIVSTFKEIKHLSDYRTVGLSDCRIIGRTPSTQSGMSIMKMTNRSGRNTDHCGMPDITSFHSELFPFIRERPFNLKGGEGYGFFLKKYSDSQYCWKIYSDFGGGKKNNLIQSFWHIT